VVEGRGHAAVKQVYLDTLNGHIPPEQGICCRSRVNPLSARSQRV